MTGLVIVTVLPWQTAIPLYGRVVAVHRVRTVAGPTDSNVGLTGYSGQEQSTVLTDLEGEVVLLTGLPANIYSTAVVSGRSRGLLPADIVYKPAWTIIIPNSAIAQFAIRDRDIIVDDEMYRYEVGASYWTGLGYQLACIRLEA